MLLRPTAALADAAGPAGDFSRLEPVLARVEAAHLVAPAPQRPVVADEPHAHGPMQTGVASAPIWPAPTPEIATAPAGAPRTEVGHAPRSVSLIRLLKRALAAVLAGLFVLLLLVLGLIVAYRTIDPPFTTLTLARHLNGATVRQHWVPLSRISPQLVRAVVMSEDARFCSHNGIDLAELEAAIERAQDGIPRGGSTISMQVTKNLFLWPAKSYLRKAIELPLTLVLEAALPKARILEIYLNIAEWGPGVFGVEAASRTHFSKPAARLNEREAALLAVTLPSPLTRTPATPGPGLQRLAGTIQARMRGADSAIACLRLGSAGRS